MSVRGKVALELGILAALTVIFLLLFPVRNPAVDMGLAGFALVCIGLTTGYTRKVIWAASPPKPEPHPLQRCSLLTLWVSLPPLLLFLLIGLWLGYRQGGWTGAAARVLDWKILLAFACYVPWALMQQTLFQFYLLGRLLALFPKVPPLALVAVTGVAYAQVHLPDLWTTLATIVGGVVWSWLYYRYRRLLPLACSHAALGSAFYYWVCGRDLVAEFERLFQ